MTPKSCTEALGSVSENSCFFMVSEEYKKFHLPQKRITTHGSLAHLDANGIIGDRKISNLRETLRRGICVVYVQAIRETPRRAKFPRKMGDENM